LFTDEKTYTVTPKNPLNDRLYAYPSTKKKAVRWNACAHNYRSLTDGISRWL